MILIGIVPVQAKIIEKVVAYVQDEAITLSEVCDYWKTLKQIHKNVSLHDALEGLLNRKMLLYKAKQLNLIAKTDDELIELYIRFTIKPKIKISKQQVRDYYNKYYRKLKGTTLFEIQDKIVRILYEKETNRLLKNHLTQLREELNVGINDPLYRNICN